MAQSKGFYGDIKKEIECPVCQEQFSDSNEPKVLQCQHTFCKSCLEGWLRQHRGGALTCPNCRQKTECPNDNIDCLPSNLTSKNLIDILKAYSTNGEQGETFCERHKEKVKFYCEQCEICICSDCAIVDHRDSNYHNIISLEEGARKQKANIERKMRELVANSSRLESYVSVLETRRVIANRSVEQATKEVYRVVERCINSIRQHESSVTELLKTQKSSCNDDFSKELSKLTEKIQRTNNVTAQCKNILQRNNLQEMLNIKQVLDEKIVEEALPVLSYPEFRYISDDALFQNFTPGQLYITNTEPSLSVATGNGLTKGTQGKEGTFTVTTNDSKGQVTYSEIDNVSVEIKSDLMGTEDIPSLPSVVKDLKDGRYSVSYTPKFAGNFSVSIKVRDEPIKGSPFTLVITKKVAIQQAEETVLNIGGALLKIDRCPEEKNTDEVFSQVKAVLHPFDFDIQFQKAEHPQGKVLLEACETKRSVHPRVIKVQTFIMNPVVFRFLSKFRNEKLQEIAKKCLVELATSNGGAQVTLEPKRDCDLTRYNDACSEFSTLIETFSQGRIFREMDLSGCDESSVNAVIEFVQTKYPVIVEEPQENGQFVVYGDAASVHQVMLTIQGGLSEQPRFDTAMFAKGMGTVPTEVVSIETSSHQTEKGVTISLRYGDITGEVVDAIVNPANAFLGHGAGLALSIVQKGGIEIQWESEKLIRERGFQSLHIGDAVYTTAGSLPCKFIIHAVGPEWNQQTKRKSMKLLQKACVESLKLASQLGLSSVAVPAVSSGIFRASLDDYAFAMLNAVEEYLTMPNVVKKKDAKAKASKATGQKKIDEKETGNKEEQRKKIEAPTKTSEGEEDLAKPGSLKDIRFVLTDADSMDVFEREFVKRFGVGPKDISDDDSDDEALPATFRSINRGSQWGSDFYG